MDIDMQYAWIPPGQFLMGGRANDNEKPQRRITISKGFWMGIYPITQVQYESVMGYNPSNFRDGLSVLKSLGELVSARARQEAREMASHFRGENRPVVNVSWDDVQEFCKKLRELTGKPVRLPTEAEWEYACRSGEGGDYYAGNGEEVLKQIGWFMGNSNSQTQPVGQKKSNKWNLYDMHGNVWEWCQDFYDEKFYQTGTTTDPICSNNQSNARVLRGGSWGTDAAGCRAAFRNWIAPGTRSDGYGFRVVFCLD